MKVDVGRENLDLVAAVRGHALDLPEDGDGVAGTDHHGRLLHHLKAVQNNWKAAYRALKGPKVSQTRTIAGAFKSSCVMSLKEPLFASLGSHYRNEIKPATTAYTSAKKSLTSDLPTAT